MPATAAMARTSPSTRRSRGVRSAAAKDSTLGSKGARSSGSGGSIIQICCMPALKGFFGEPRRGVDLGHDVEEHPLRIGEEARADDGHGAEVVDGVLVGGHGLDLAAAHAPQARAVAQGHEGHDAEGIAHERLAARRRPGLERRGVGPASPGARARRSSPTGWASGSAGDATHSGR